MTYLNNNDARYLRETALSAFATDDYRVLSNLTINGGLRWEYFSPYTEKNGQMADLDFAPGFTAVAQVLPGQTGPYSGAFPHGFIKPDYKMFSPRIGIAWKPWKSKQIVVRSGYGIYYNGGVYSQLAQRLVGQPPFATTTQVFQSAADSFVARGRLSRRAVRSDCQYVHGGQELPSRLCAELDDLHSGIVRQIVCFHSCLQRHQRHGSGRSATAEPRPSRHAAAERAEQPDDSECGRIYLRQLGGKFELQRRPVSTGAALRARRILRHPLYVLESH